MQQVAGTTSLTTEQSSQLHDRAHWVRRWVVDMAAIAGSGHIGPSLSCTDILVSLYYGFMDVDVAKKARPDRDKFVLSKGHACSALYPILADLGYFPLEDLKTFTRLGTNLGDHPNMRKVAGVDFSSGSLGHGLAIGVGMAEAGRLRGTTERTVVMLGDGELNEGQIWEAAGYASARGLGSLLAIVDQNHVQVDGKTVDVLNFEPIDEKFRAFGWIVEKVDGHSFEALVAAYKRYDERRKTPNCQPTVILADTVSGKGISYIEGMAEWHIGFLAGEDYERALAGFKSLHAIQ